MDVNQTPGPCTGIPKQEPADEETLSFQWPYFPNPNHATCSLDAPHAQFPPSDMRRQMIYTNLMHAQNPDLDDDELGETNIANLGATDSTQIHARTRKNGRQGNFTPEEDKLLISGWINVSQNLIIGHDQKVTAFWQRVTDYYDNHRLVGRETERTMDSLKCRWKLMQRNASKFNAAFSEIERQNRSGTTDVDKLNTSRVLDYDNHNTTFTVGLTSETSSPSEMGSASINTGDVRPIGRKAEKAAKRKGSNVSGPSKMSDVQFVDYQNLKVKMHEERMEMQRRQLIANEERFQEAKYLNRENMRIAKEKMDFEKKKYEDEKEERILNIDTSTMDPSLAEWYEYQKRKILGRYTRGGDS